MTDSVDLFEFLFGQDDRLSLSDEGSSFSPADLLRAVESIDVDSSQRNIVFETTPIETVVEVIGSWRRGGHPAVVRSGTPPALVDRLEDVLGSVPVHETESLVVVTSGTTGSPKPVALPAESLRLNATAISARLDLSPNDNLLCQLPLGHLFGISGSVAAAAAVGAHVTMRSPTTPPSVIEDIVFEEHVTVVQGAPAFFRLFGEYWSGRPMESVRFVTIAGELVEPQLRRQLRDLFPMASIEVGFGMTEAGPRISHCSLGDDRVGDGYVGEPFAHWETETRESPLGARLALRGDALMLGYLDRDGYSGIGDDGWFVSDDLVDLEDGGIFHRGRADSVFKRGGTLVNPIHVEIAALMFDDVFDARCSRRSHPILGGVPVLSVTGSRSLSSVELMEHLRNELEKPSVPIDIEVVDRLEPRKGPTGDSAITHTR